MSGHSTLVGGQQLDEVIRRIIAEVLVIAPGEVQRGKALVRDLGAESIDFLDLVFQLEDALGFGVPYQRWQRYVTAHYAGQDLAAVITTDVIEAFAVEVMSEQALAAS